MTSLFSAGEGENASLLQKKKGEKRNLDTHLVGSERQEPVDFPALSIPQEKYQTRTLLRNRVEAEYTRH